MSFPFITTTSTGNISIVTTNPSTQLEISSNDLVVLKLNGDSQNNAANDDGRLQTQIQMRSDGLLDYGFNINHYNGAGTHTFGIEDIKGTVGNTRMYIGGTGNIGIGTTSPSGILTIASGSCNMSTVVDGNTNYRTSITSGNAGTSIVYNFQTGKNVIWGETSDTGIYLFRGRNVQVPTITVNESATTFAGALSRLIIKDDASVNWLSVFHHNGAGTASNQTIAFVRANTQVGGISIGGGATAYNTTSDYRLKKNIIPITGALSKLKQINPVSYQWTIDDSYADGFIAHELNDVYPQAVTGEKDEMYPDGNIKPQSVDYSKLVALLTSAIKELKNEFDEYKATHP